MGKDIFYKIADEEDLERYIKENPKYNYMKTEKLPFYINSEGRWFSDSEYDRQWLLEEVVVNYKKELPKKDEKPRTFLNLFGLIE